MQDNVWLESFARVVIPVGLTASLQQLELCLNSRREYAFLIVERRALVLYDMLNVPSPVITTLHITLCYWERVCVVCTLMTTIDTAVRFWRGLQVQRAASRHRFSSRGIYACPLALTEITERSFQGTNCAKTVYLCFFSLGQVVWRVAANASCGFLSRSSASRESQ